MSLAGAGQQWAAAVARLDPSQKRVDLAGDPRLSVDVLTGRIDDLPDPSGVQSQRPVERESGDDRFGPTRQIGAERQRRGVQAGLLISGVRPSLLTARW